MKPLLVSSCCHDMGKNRCQNMAQISHGPIPKRFQTIKCTLPSSRLLLPTTRKTAFFLLSYSARLEMRASGCLLPYNLLNMSTHCMVSSRESIHPSFYSRLCSVEDQSKPILQGILFNIDGTFCSPPNLLKS